VWYRRVAHPHTRYVSRVSPLPGVRDVPLTSPEAARRLIAEAAETPPEIDDPAADTPWVRLSAQGSGRACYGSEPARLAKRATRFFVLWVAFAARMGSAGLHSPPRKLMGESRSDSSRLSDAERRDRRPRWS